MEADPERKADAESEARLKIGDAAERAGLSVRALHHYEATGLVTPTRSPAGHRVYSMRDVHCLKRIANLRAMGLSVEEVRACLADERLTPRRILELRLSAHQEHIAELKRSAEQLENVLLTVAASDAGGTYDLWTAVDAVASIEAHLEPDQYAKWTDSRRELGARGIAEREQMFRELVSAVRHELNRGTPPEREPMPSLAQRWEAFAQETYCNDEALRGNMAAAISRVPGLVERLGTDRALLRYVARALSHVNESTHQVT